MNWPAHGSNPQYLFEALNKKAPKEMIDFSANINPLGPPPVIKENWTLVYSKITDYPDPNGKQLREKLAKQNGLEENQVLIGNGGAEIISLIGRMLSGKNVVIVQPAFSEYETACRVNDCQVEYHQLTPGDWQWQTAQLSTKLGKADAMFLCNPSNPTGVYYPKSVILDVLQLCKENGCLLIIDEAFYDFVPEYQEVVSYINDFQNLLIIRSMTKMYALPGLRLGYALGDAGLIKKLEAYQPQWSVNAIALQAGEWCLECEEYRKETLELINNEKQRLFAFYEKQGFLTSPSYTNFYLLRDPELEDQFELFQFLLEKGIIPRHTMNFPGICGEWLRFAVKAPAENTILMGAFKEWRKRHPLSL